MGWGVEGWGGVVSAVGWGVDEWGCTYSGVGCRGVG